MVVVDAGALGAIHFGGLTIFAQSSAIARSSTRSFSIVERIDGLISLRKILLWRICKDCVVVYTR